MSESNLRPGDIKSFIINGTNLLSPPVVALIDLRYYENVLSNVITFSVGVQDTDNYLNKLPIKGGDKVDIKIEDSSGRIIKSTFNINKIRNVVSDTLESDYFLDLASEEYFKNEETRVITRYDGKISENVKKIMKEKLSVTMKDKDVDETLVNYNFIGNNRKPLYVCSWLASKSIPATAGKLGGAAGYLFFENQKGFQFKSIDGLFKQPSTKKYILTSTPFAPRGYDGKILNYSIDRDIDLSNNLAIGMYSNKSIFFNFYDYDYVEKDYTVEDNKQDNAGRDSVLSSISNFGNDPSRIMSRILDVGTLPLGKTTEDQLKAWKEDPTNPTFNAPQTMVQSVMRYNQMFAIKINITIAADFSLKAGDLIYCDFPEVSTNKNSGVDKRSGGIYMISSVCHRLTSNQSSTNLTLVRDTFGRKPFKV